MPYSAGAATRGKTLQRSTLGKIKKAASLCETTFVLRAHEGTRTPTTYVIRS